MSPPLEIQSSLTRYDHISDVELPPVVSRKASCPITTGREAIVSDERHIKHMIYDCVNRLTWLLIGSIQNTSVRLCVQYIASGQARAGSIIDYIL